MKRTGLILVILTFTFGCAHRSVKTAVPRPAQAGGLTDLVMGCWGASSSSGISGESLLAAELCTPVSEPFQDAFFEVHLPAGLHMQDLEIDFTITEVSRETSFWKVIKNYPPTLSQAGQRVPLYFHDFVKEPKDGKLTLSVRISDSQASLTLGGAKVLFRKSK